MKKSILLFTLLVGTLGLYAQCPAFQNNLEQNGLHLKDVNTLQLLDGSEDYAIIGTQFSNNFGAERLFVTRVDDLTGAPVWTREYDGSIVSRGFDAVRYQELGDELIAVTGYVDGPQFNRTVILILDAINGSIIAQESYEIDPNFNSQGLKIIYTERDYNGVATPGFVVGGYYNFDYDVNLANNSAGFIMRTDLNLNVLWTQSTMSNTTAAVDYDMINHISETNDGYFATGSLNEPTGARQGVLLLKLDDNGMNVWSSSYVEGNFRDVGVDAYYDVATNELFVLTYYSAYHYFGVTVVDNASGTIDFGKSRYYQNPNELNRTGFSIMKSADLNFPDDLVIMGYEKDGDFIDPSGVLLTANTQPFAISFDKNNGAINRFYKYPVPYQDPVAYSDYFRFWVGQSPLIYHPDIGFPLANGDCYFMVANRSYGQGSTAVEMIMLDQSLNNVCLFDGLTATLNPLGITALPVQVNTETGTPMGLALNRLTFDLALEDCEAGGILATSDLKLDELKIVPNPAQDYISILGYDDGYNSFKIYNNTGALIFEGSTSEGTSISVSQLSSGLYFIEIAREAEVTIKKFIKE